MNESSEKPLNYVPRLELIDLYYKVKVEIKVSSSRCDSQRWSFITVLFSALIFYRGVILNIAAEGLSACIALLTGIRACDLIRRGVYWLPYFFNTPTTILQKLILRLVTWWTVMTDMTYSLMFESRRITKCSENFHFNFCNEAHLS